MEQYIATQDFTAWPPEPGEKVHVSKGTRLELTHFCLFSAEMSMPDGTIISVSRKKAEGYAQYFAPYEHCQEETPENGEWWSTMSDAEYAFRQKKLPQTK